MRYILDPSWIRSTHLPSSIYKRDVYLSLCRSRLVPPFLRRVWSASSGLINALNFARRCYTENTRKFRHLSHESQKQNRKLLKIRVMERRSRDLSKTLSLSQDNRGEIVHTSICLFVRARQSTRGYVWSISTCLLEPKGIYAWAFPAKVFVYGFLFLWTQHVYSSIRTAWPARDA